MLLPPTTYVVDNNGQKKFVQVAIQDWDRLINELQRLENLLQFKSKLKSAFQEVHQIKKGKKIGISLSQLIDEL
jgi:hypothetical protein